MKKSCLQNSFLAAMAAAGALAYGPVQGEQISGERAREICATGDTGPVTSYGEFPEETAAKKIVFEWNCMMMVERDVEAAFERYVDENWCDHGHMVTRGENRCGTYEETMALFARMNSEPLEDDETIEFPTQYMVNSDHVTVYGAGVDIFRVVDGKLTDHWDASPTRAISFEDKPEGMAERIMSGQMFQGPAEDEPTTMRAIRVYGTELRLDEVPVPQPGEGQVRIRVYAAGVNPFERPRPPGEGRNVEQPRMVGGDVAGVIDRPGPGVAGWQPGDAVITAMQEAPRVDGAAQGSYAEYVVARAADVVAKSDRMTFEEAAGVPTVGITAWRELFERASVNSGDRVLILGGSGGVGTAAVQLAKSIGAYVISTASTGAQQHLLNIGVDQPVDYTTTDLPDVVSDVDLMFGTVGRDSVVEALPVMREGGVVVSIAGEPTEAECRSAGVTCPMWAPNSAELNRQRLTGVSQAIDAGQYRTVVMRVFPLEEAGAAQDLLAARGTIGKIILSIHPDSATR